MKPLRLFLLLCFVAPLVGASQAEAGGLLSRLRGNVQRSSPTQTYPATRSRSYPTRNLNQGRSRLPAGRTYYRGRYFGNYNNRFYGPQYGYF